MKWQRHISGVSTGVMILSLQLDIAIATLTDLDGDHVVMVRGSNSGSIRTSSAYIDEDIIATANEILLMIKFLRDNLHRIIEGY